MMKNVDDVLYNECIAEQTRRGEILYGVRIRSKKSDEYKH